MAEIPFQVKPETGAFERLLASVPAYLAADKDPQAQPALSILYNGEGAHASVAQRQLSIVVAGGAGEPLVLSLEGKTLSALAAEINAHEGFMATVVGDDGSALTLLPVQGHDLMSDSVLVRFTSVLWCVLMPFAWATEDLMEQAAAGERQGSLATAEGQWVDLWGSYYADVARRFNEEDRAYARRIIREVTRWKLNNAALADILEEETGLLARVEDLHPQAWEMGRTKFGRLAGRKYSRTTFEVILSDFFDGVALFVNQYRAAGMLPFYRFEIAMGLPDASEFSVTEQTESTHDVGSRLAWVMGRDPMGALPCTDLSHTVVNEYVLPPSSELLLLVGNAGSPFILGTGELGSEVLGDVSMAGMVLSEGASTFVGKNL